MSVHPERVVAESDSASPAVPRSGPSAPDPTEPLAGPRALADDGVECDRSSSADRSPYLVKRLLETSDENLFNHVKFSLIKDVIDELGLQRPRVLDVGCGLQVAKLYLKRLGVDMEYFGIDYEPRFGPDAVIDLAHIDTVADVLPWAPDVILALDVLEHLDEDPAAVRDAIGKLASITPPDATLIVTLPQMYRLDRFKAPHLHYPEHKIRLTRQEWRALLEHGFRIDDERGLGYLSVLPYLPMASRHYRPENRLGRLFRHLRERTFEWAPLKPADLWLSRRLGRRAAFKGLSNDVLFVASPRPGVSGA